MVCYKTLEGAGVITTLLPPLIVIGGVVYRHKDFVFVAIRIGIPAIQLHTTGNSREKRPASRFEMPGVKRVFDIAAFRISTAEGAVKLLKSDKSALGTAVNSRGAVTVQAVQLVVGVVIVQGAGDILCILLLGKSAAVINVHNGRVFAAFGIVAGAFLAPVAVAENVVVA